MLDRFFALCLFFTIGAIFFFYPPLDALIMTICLGTVICQPKSIPVHLTTSAMALVAVGFDALIILNGIYLAGYVVHLLAYVRENRMPRTKRDSHGY